MKLFSRRVPAAQRALLFRSLAVMVGSGVNVDASLRMLARQVEHPGLRQACEELSKRIAGGHYLSTSMQRLGWAFTQMQMRLVDVGEKSGQLVHVLTQIADYEEKSLELSMKVRSSLIVPLLISAACLVMVALAPPLLFRGLFEILQEGGGSLPWPTRLLIFISDCLYSPWAYLVLVLLALLGYQFVLQLTRNGPLWRQLFGWWRRWPVLGNALQVSATSRFAHCLATLMRVGMPLLPSLIQSARASGDPCVVEAVTAAQKEVGQGELLGQALLEAGCFPAGFCHGISAGEESGQLADMLASMARLYEVEMAHTVEVVSKSLEPVMLGIVGSIVCFTVVATLLPMLKVIESL